MPVPRRPARSGIHGGAILVDDLEDVTVDGFAKEEPLERRGPQWIEQAGTLCLEAAFQRSKSGERIEHGDVASELVLERRDAESLYVEDVHLLSAPQIEPYEFDGRVGWHGQT